jgi:hypothetical protein
MYTDRSGSFPRSASEGRLQLDGGFLKNEAIHCSEHKSNCQIEPMKITLPSYCEATQSIEFVWPDPPHPTIILPPMQMKSQS